MKSEKIKLLVKHPLYVLKKLAPSRIVCYIKYSKIKRQNLNGDIADLLEFDPIISSNEIDDYPKLQIPLVEIPKVSIIIPVYNQFAYTYNCIRSIIKYSEGIDYEVILADDCSCDLTKKIKKVIANLRVVRNKENMKFLKNCNGAAIHARGEYLVFLNNDTQVQKEWLANMLQIFEKYSDVGMTGAKLVYPDGILQEAGGIVRRDGSAFNFGNGCNPANEIFCKIREVDYISGAAIMISRELWVQIGGFDEIFTPAYYEDTDLAFAVRQAGYKVVLQPNSIVVHFEGMTNGTDKSSGIKEHQIQNEMIFHRKWKKVLKRRKKWGYYEI